MSENGAEQEILRQIRWRLTYIAVILTLILILMPIPGI